MKKNVIISSVLVIALCLSVIAGSTFALFTSESTVNASVSAGNVKLSATVDRIILDSTLGENLPETSATYYPDSNIITLQKLVPGDFVTFNINVSNESDVTVNYRTKISVVDDNGLWNGLEVTIGDTIYNGAAKISSWSTLLPGSEDIVVPVKVSLPEDRTNEYQGKSCSFAYTVEAIQGNFDVSTIPNNEASFNDILEEGGDVFLLTDLTTTDTVSAYSGVAAITMTNGGYINGNGNTLTVNNANNTWDSAIFTKGGTIENITVNGSFRGIMVGDSLGGDLILNNVVIDKVCYTFHADGTKEQANGYKVVINNSVLNGWTSYSPNVSVVEFNNCSFGKGTGAYDYAYMRPYAPTVLTNCTFSEDYALDARQTDAIVLDNCYVGETLITAENITELLGANAANANVVVKLSDNAEISDALTGGAYVALEGDVVTAGAVVVGPNGINEAYGNAIGFAQYGGCLDGKGNSITVNDLYTYVVVTHGGTIKNVTIADGGRGVILYAPTEDVIIENVVIDGPGYAINTTEHARPDDHVKLYVKNSTVNGWTSIAGLEEVIFTDCKFGENTKGYWQNMGYDRDYDRLIKPYVTATFENCEFEEGTYVDLSALISGNTVTFSGCTVNGVELTAENFAEYITIENYDASYVFFN